MSVTTEGFLEIRHGEAWCFVGEMVDNPAAIFSPGWGPDTEDCRPVEPDEPPEPARMPSAFFEAGYRSIAAILGGVSRRPNKPFVPVAAARGLPPHMSSQVDAWLGRLVGSPGFTGSWVTARELLDFDWIGRIMRRQAMVDRRAAHLFAGCPRGFPRERWPEGLPVMLAGDMRDGVRVEWDASYAEIVGEFYSVTLPLLQLHGPPEDVRLVLSFCY
jgi:hypothetical protein